MIRQAGSCGLDSTARLWNVFKMFFVIFGTFGFQSAGLKLLIETVLWVPRSQVPSPEQVPSLFRHSQPTISRIFYLSSLLSDHIEVLEYVPPSILRFCKRHYQHHPKERGAQHRCRTICHGGYRGSIGMNGLP